MEGTAEPRAAPRQKARSRGSHRRAASPSEEEEASELEELSDDDEELLESPLDEDASALPQQASRLSLNVCVYELSASLCEGTWRQYSESADPTRARGLPGRRCQIRAHCGCCA